MRNHLDIVDNFRQRVEDVNKLLVLDELIIGSTIDMLEERQENLRNSGIENAYMLGENALIQLRGIRDHESLKPSYKLIHNQCVVLLVSYFSSSMHDLFDAGTTMVLKSGIPKKLKSKEIKLTLTLEELHKYGFNLSENIGSIISTKFSISFQDMGSISRAIKDYLGVELPWDKTVNNIIVMQACRNAIAHAGVVADSKLINQLRNSSDRDIQKDIKEGSKVQFTPEEIKLGGAEMVKYISNLSDKVFISN